ncbi:MAG: hypothetical protein QOH60_4233 [Mycobacterium sp.]|jgi:hypothetical protein|nr:hypothetical protein [Mycobacterium sp.]
MVGAFSVAALGIPLGLALTNQPAATPLACPGSIDVNVIQIGAPVDTCNLGPMAPPITGGAPSQQTLTNCSGIPGCLSNALYGPGNVLVPDRDTTVRQSQ